MGSLRSRFEFQARWAVRPRDVRRALLDLAPDIVHFSGHGTGDDGLVFEDDTGHSAIVPTDALAELFELFSKNVRCVVLSACYSDVQAKAIAGHIDHVIGMQRALGDEAAIEFAVGFYDALAAGKDVPLAYRFGCNSIRLGGIDEHLTPILHSRQPQQECAVSGFDEGSPSRERSLPGRRQRDHHSDLHVAGVEDVMAWGWDGGALLRQLIAIDYETTDALTQAHEGDAGQWSPVFMNHPDTWRLIAAQPKRIVGYWHMAPLFPREYARAKAGRLLDSQITADVVQLFELPGLYDVYFVQICMLPSFRSPRNIQLLFQTVFDVLTRLSAHEIFVREVTANAYTRAGEALCRTFNLDLLCSHREHGAIYSGPIERVLRHGFAGRNADLCRRYADRGLM